MKRSTRTLGFTIAASLGLHGVVLLGAAWLMAVLPERARKRPASLLVCHDDKWKYRKGTSEPQADWKTAADEALDASWLEGRGWIGYGNGSPGTVLTDMRGNGTAGSGYRVVYLRKTFTVSSSIPADHEAVLDIDYDDGFIAWIDGAYADHDGLPGDIPPEPSWDTQLNVPSHECSFGDEAGDPQPVRSKVLGTVAKVLPPGTHVLSVLLLNEATDSDDAVAKIDLYTRKPIPEDVSEKEAAASEPEVAVTIVRSDAGEAGKPLKALPVEPDLTGPAKSTRFIYADGSQKVQAPLNEATALISAQDMRAASTAAPTAGSDPNRISQEGSDIPVFSLNTRSYVAGGEQPAPPPPTEPARPAEPSPPEPVEEPPPAPPPTPPAAQERPPEPQNPVKTTDPLAPAPAEKPQEKTRDPLELRDRPPDPIPLSKTPRPPVKRTRPMDPVAPSTKPGNPAKPSLSSLKSKSTGGVALRSDEASEDAKGTAEGRYHNIIKERVGAMWSAKLAGVHGLAGNGVVEVEYDIDAKGTVSNVKLVDGGKANAVLEDVCLTAIIKVKLPPPPEEMLRELRDPISGGKIHCTFSFYRLP
ncbi:MAG TPA: hypothetical protein VHM91_07135 [Verrucomicrobiales bacterium]|nr:hypothetical protein [Verrucomicrobiales bacterium]